LRVADPTFFPGQNKLPTMGPNYGMVGGLGHIYYNANPAYYKKERAENLAKISELFPDGI